MDRKKSGSTRQAVSAQIIIKAPGSGQDLYLLQLNERWKQYALLGGLVENGETPVKAACHELEEELGGVRVGWDVMVEPLQGEEPLTLSGMSGSTWEETDYTFYLFQGFFVRPIHDFAYLWAGDKTRWFSKEDIQRSNKVSKFPWAEMNTFLKGGADALPNTWEAYLQALYSTSFDLALQDFNNKRRTLSTQQPATVILKNIQSPHLPGLGAVLRRALLRVERAGQRVFRRVRFEERPDDCMLKLELVGRFPVEPSHLQDAWAALAGPAHEERVVP